MKKESKYRVLLLIVFLSLLPLGCVGKPPDDDVALIKELLVKFEKGLKEKNPKALGLVINKKEKNLASKMITDFSAWGELKNIYIASRRFTIVGDSAKVALKLKMQTPEGGKESEEFEKPVNLFLNKKKGKWRIKTYEIMTNDSSKVEWTGRPVPYLVILNRALHRLVQGGVKNLGFVRRDSSPLRARMTIMVHPVERWMTNMEIS